ncbi:MAG: hypothetical protein AAGA68_23260 [Pseudomonadota bacterium]
MSRLLRTIWAQHPGLTACCWMFLAVLSAGVPRAHSATFEQLVTDTAPPVSDAEVARLKANLVGAYRPVTIVNTRYLVNAKPPGGPVFLKTHGSTTRDKRPPKYNVLEWQLEVEGQMTVSAQSIAEIRAYWDRLEREAVELQESVQSLTEEQRTATGKAKTTLRDRFKETRARERRNKRDLATTKVMHAVFEDALREEIAALNFALIRARSAVAVNYHESTDSVSNLEQLTESIALREPLLIFDGGFYLFEARPSPRFKRYERRGPNVGSQTRAILNDTYNRWGERCAVLRKFSADLQDNSLVQRCETTRDQLLQWPGVIERSNHLFWGEVAVPEPTPAEQNLFLRPTRRGLVPAAAWPPLDYMQVRDCSTAQLDYERIRGRSFADTLWSLERRPRYAARQQVIGKNWDAALATRYRNTGSLGAAIFLRADGVIGIDNVFDDQHRWAYEEKGIVLRLFAGEITLTVDPQYDGIMILNHVQAQNDRLYTYRMRLLMQYSASPLSRYGLNVDYLNSLGRRPAMPRALGLCDASGKPIRVVGRIPKQAASPPPSPAARQAPPVTAGRVPERAAVPTPGLQPLANSSFEAPRVAQYQFAMEQWQGQRHGVVTPPATMYPGGLAPGGRQVAYLSKAGSWMAQTLSHPPAPGWTYTLQVWAGNRLEPGFESGHFHLELLSGEEVVASRRFATPQKGEFAPFDLIYEAPNTPLVGALTVRVRNEDARQVNYDLLRLYAYPPGSGETPPALTRENRSATPETAVTAPVQRATEIVGFWDYDAIDGQAIAAGLILRAQTGSALGERWSSVLELKHHDRLRPRARSLWPVHLKRDERRVCINFPGYPSYSAFIDIDGDAHDGVYAFGPCTGD